ncbi:LysR family transcriptional regulator [Pseudooceanicola sp. CBS1P-1]|uniref:LysR family transcriptional regulator n=1 Tax=Pseudooceanicola albus TaxID=2692189 RepID=A0A6L7FZK5_9RHOB|nr:MULTISPECIES: LysR family transcriptional regulator [Pseudooceanicola]MBT9382320.1 LysR family transcriptional regulator [Pseudooceanicola endophyticus]MXN16862.1 LysR family transcriptional regulator [Pseudooceanicola albus]
MIRENISDLIAFAAVAEERSFTRAAAKLNVSQSALSHTIKALEQRLGLRLLTRTTRSVAPTLAGEDLLATLNPCFEMIETRLQALNDSRDEPAGTVRIVAVEYAIESLLWPKLSPVLKAHPGVKVEFVMDYGFTDLAAAQCDAGVRYGDQVSEGMIAMRIGPDERMICVGSPGYYAARGTPATPQALTDHACINLRLSTHGALYAWEFEDAQGRELNIRVQGQATFNTINPVMRAAVDGHGLALIPERLAQPHLDSGALVACLGDYCPSFPGFHLYYPSRQRSSSAFDVVLEALRES